MRRVGVSLLALLVLAGALTIVGPDVALAAQNTCGAGPTSRFEGMTESVVSSDWGARATIPFGGPSLCATNQSQGSNFSTPWAMLREVTPRSAYMQAGYMTRWGDCTRVFTEHDRDGNGSVYPFRRTFGPCVGGTVTYSVFVDMNCQCSRLGYSFIILDSTEYGILAEWSNLRSDFLAETLYAESDIAGTAQDPAALQALSVQRPFASGFTANTTPLTDLHQVDRYHHGSLYLNSFLIWTDPV